MRKNGLEELILTRIVDEKRSRGRQREKYLTNLSRWWQNKSQGEKKIKERK